MNELDRYIAEIVRVRRSIQLYIELFTKDESVHVLNDFSGDVFGVLQRSLHDEIIISLSRLFDGKHFIYKKEKKENLSQLNLVSKYDSLLTDRHNKLRRKTKELLEHIDLKDYRDWKVAHNDKDTITGKNGVIKHNIDSETVISLLEKSLSLIIDIKSKVEKKESVSVPVILTEKYEGKGTKFVDKISKI